MFFFQHDITSLVVKRRVFVVIVRLHLKQIVREQTKHSLWLSFITYYLFRITDDSFYEIRVSSGQVIIVKVSWWGLQCLPLHEHSHPCRVIDVTQTVRDTVLLYPPRCGLYIRTSRYEYIGTYLGSLIALLFVCNDGRCQSIYIYLPTPTSYTRRHQSYYMLHL